MTFSTHLQIKGNPEFEVKAKAAPLSFQLGGEASLGFETEPIHGHIDQIPVHVRVPFMKHNHGYVMAASIGPFGLHLHEIKATARVFGVEVGGLLGKEGIECDLAGMVRCCMEADASTKLPSKAIEAAVKAVIEE
jgi:hypothetical protein